MPQLPPIGRDVIRSETNRLGLPERFVRWIEQVREILRPVPDLIQADGDPNGTQSAVRGTFYLRTDGGPGTRLYVKTSTSGTSGWEAVG